jgi:hypothetical protein
MPNRLAANCALRLIAVAALACAVAGCSTAGVSIPPSTSAARTGSPAASPYTAPSSLSAAAPSVNLAAEVDATVAGLDEALRLYKAGNLQGALDAVAETYEEHFELIEDPLEKVNDDLKEDLEGVIATKLRQGIQANAPVADIEKLVAEATTKLALAKDLLK